ncbi:MAG: cbb3-type cytochrome c oxidase subunit I, partial [Gemmatimonadetes bacterium]|nr:cbb3-type cytochrome c oxidase subunit I [Gemmatimonadota bacterium]
MEATAATPDSLESSSRLWSWITTTDHKRIGILYGATAFVFLLIGGLEAMLIRWQLMKPDNDFVSAETFSELFTMHGT